MTEQLNLFPSFLPTEVAGRVGQSWTIHAGKFPLPTFQPYCPQCESDAVQLSRINFGMRPHSPSPWRADVSFKCTWCSMFWTHGVPISREVYQKAGGKKYDWRQVAKEVFSAHANA